MIYRANKKIILIKAGVYEGTFHHSFPDLFSLTLGHVITPEAFLQVCNLTEEPKIPHCIDNSLRSHSYP